MSKWRGDKNINSINIWNFPALLSCRSPNQQSDGQGSWSCFLRWKTRTGPVMNSQPACKSEYNVRINVFMDLCIDHIKSCLNDNRRHLTTFLLGEINNILSFKYKSDHHRREFDVPLRPSSWIWSGRISLVVRYITLNRPKLVQNRCVLDL